MEFIDQLIDYPINRASPSNKPASRIWPFWQRVYIAAILLQHFHFGKGRRQIQLNDHKKKRWQADSAALFPRRWLLKNGFLEDVENRVGAF